MAPTGEQGAKGVTPCWTAGVVGRAGGVVPRPVGFGAGFTDGRFEGVDRRAGVRVVGGVGVAPVAARDGDRDGVPLGDPASVTGSSHDAGVPGPPNRLRPGRPIPVGA
ncbi:hypothetical protein [Micromonospora zhanjiangensis]